MIPEKKFHIGLTCSSNCLLLAFTFSITFLPKHLVMQFKSGILLRHESQAGEPMAFFPPRAMPLFFQAGRPMQAKNYNTVIAMHVVYTSKKNESDIKCLIVEGIM